MAAGRTTPATAGGTTDRARLAADNLAVFESYAHALAEHGSEREIVVAGQVVLDGEVTIGGRPLTGVLGAPVVLGPEGWTRVLLDEPAPDETARLLRCRDRIDRTLAPWGLGRAGDCS
ncbi:MAG: hypothetical protein ACOH2F_08520 [Cellulomonas sp.]